MATVNFCVSCGTKVSSPSDRFCSECGASLELGTPDLIVEAPHVTDGYSNGVTIPDELIVKANSGDAAAMKDLGMLFYDKGDESTANAWFRKAAALGHAGATRNLGVSAAEAGDFESAKAYFTRAFELGDTIAGANIVGLLVEHHHDDEARQWLNQLRDRNELLAFVIAAMTLIERGDTDEAKAILIEASDLGFGPAIEFLVSNLAQWEDASGTEYWALKGVERSKTVSPEEADQWRKLSGAEPGVGSMFILGALAYDEEDWDEARRWFEAAAALGHAESANMLEELDDM